MAKRPELVVAGSSIQDRAQGKGDGSVMPLPILMFRDTTPLSTLPAWWSMQRDVELRRFAKSEGLLSSSIYTMQAIVASTGFVIEGDKPRALAKARVPIDQADYGAGTSVLLKKLAEDWLSQDNGIFVELEGPGNISSPLVVPPTRVNHIDAGRCWRSADMEHPVWYYSSDDMRWVKMHWTRVAFSAPNPSGLETARGLGYCAVSRVESMSAVIKSIVKYKQEKTSGRHSRGILYGSVPPNVVAKAFEVAQEVADSRNEVAYSSYPYVGSPVGGTEVNLGLLELSSLPDGFEWESELSLYMYCLALALGLDARELWPATASGATKADAEIQHRKAMRKGVGDFLSTVEGIFNSRVLPEGITHTFKPKDNEEDKEQAEIEDTKVTAVEKMLAMRVVTVKGAAVLLVNSGVLPPAYLENPELSDAALDEPKEEPAPPVDQSGDETVIEDEDDTGSDGGGNSDDEAVAEDENDVTKPPKAKKQGEEPVPDGPPITQSIIAREMELWRNHPLLSKYVEPLEEVGGIDKLPAGDSVPVEAQRGVIKSLLMVIRKQAGTIPNASREALLDVRMAIFQEQTDRLASSLANGTMHIDDWRREMRAAISAMHTGAGALGRGGWSAMSFSDWGIVGAEIKRQYSFLDVWAQDITEAIRAGNTPSEAVIAMRSRMYGASATSSFNRMLQVDMGINPSILPAQPGDGTTDCYTKCRCRWRFVPINLANGDWDAYWELGVAEHCDACRARAARWAPLRIRGGQVGGGQATPDLFR